MSDISNIDIITPMPLIIKIILFSPHKSLFYKDLRKKTSKKGENRYIKGGGDPELWYNIR